MLDYLSPLIVGVGGLGAGLVAWWALRRRGKRERDALVEAHPEEPWFWRPDWARGLIRNSARPLVGPLLFAGLWNLVCLPLWFILPREIIRAGDRVAWLAMVFPIIGLWLAGWAIVSVMRWRKYGRSVFEMASVPGVVGGHLAGVIRAPGRIEPEDVFRVRLSCVNSVMTKGSDGHISRRLVWQDEQVLTRDLPRRDARRSAVPVLFQIPYECRETDERSPDNMILWNLEVTAKTPGFDYVAEFDVPVFKTPQSDPDFVVDRGLIAKYEAPHDPERDLRDAGLVREPSATGEGWRLVFPMARQPGAAVGMTVGSLLFFGAPAVWMVLDFEWIAVPFGVIFGLAGLLLLATAVDLWFYRSVVDASPRGLTITGGRFGRGSSQWIDAADIVEITTASHMKSERLMYFDLIVVCRDGRRVTAGKRLPGKRLATAVIQQIEEVISRPETSIDP